MVAKKKKRKTKVARAGGVTININTTSPPKAKAKRESAPRRGRGSLPRQGQTDVSALIAATNQQKLAYESQIALLRAFNGQQYVQPQYVQPQPQYVQPPQIEAQADQPPQPPALPQIEAQPNEVHHAILAANFPQIEGPQVQQASEPDPFHHSILPPAAPDEFHHSILPPRGRDPNPRSPPDETDDDDDDPEFIDADAGPAIYDLDTAQGRVDDFFAGGGGRNPHPVKTVPQQEMENIKRLKTRVRELSAKRKKAASGGGVQESLVEKSEHAKAIIELHKAESARKSRIASTRKTRSSVAYDFIKAGLAKVSTPFSPEEQGFRASSSLDTVTKQQEAYQSALQAAAAESPLREPEGPPIELVLPKAAPKKTKK